MYACKFFPQSKTADISKLLLIEYYLKLILTQHIHLGQLTKAPICWKLQVSNVTSSHRLSTSINTAWEAATEECDELAVLDTSSNNLVKFVKKSGGIQYNLPATLKSCGKTRPWRSLISKFSSIITSYETIIKR